jgi:hypothetical protein
VHDQYLLCQNSINRLNQDDTKAVGEGTYINPAATLHGACFIDDLPGGVIDDHAGHIFSGFNLKVIAGGVREYPEAGSIRNILYIKGPPEQQTTPVRSIPGYVL